MRRAIQTAFACCVLPLALLMPLPASADDATVLILQIQKDLRGVTRDLSNLGDANTDEDDVDKVADKVWDLVEPLIDLIYERKDDHQVQTMVKGYPESMDDLLAALVTMREVKKLQGVIGGNDEIEFCDTYYPRELPRELKVALAKAGVDADDLKKIAKGFAANAEEFIEAAEKILKEIDELRDDVKAYRAKHRDFNALAHALGEAADDVYDAEQGIFEELEDVCSPFVDWEKHPAYKDAMQILEDEGVAIAVFEDDGKEWLGSIKGIDDDICESLALVRDALCQKDWEPNNTDALRLYDDLANQAAKDFRNRLSALVRVYERDLRDRGQTLAPRDRDTKKLFDEVTAKAAWMNALIHGKPLMGSNNPKVRVWRNYGIEQHRDLQRDYRCNVAEKVIPSATMRNLPDCVLIEDCEIIEFKPNTPKGLADGEKISVYVNALNRWVQAQWPKYENDPVPPRRDSQGMGFDADFIMQARAHGCIDDDGTSLFTGFVLPYNSCDQDKELACRID